jgi:hypothetical protein
MIVPALAASALARIAPVLGAGLGRLWAAIRSPAVLAILALALGWQTLRIEGLHWTLSIAGLRLPVIARDGLRDRLPRRRPISPASPPPRRRPAPIRPPPTTIPPPSRPGSRRSPMPKLPDIMRKGALLALPGLLLTACTTPALRVAPQTPLCPEPITLPRSMTDPVTLPRWLPSPRRLRPLHRQQRPPRPDASGRPRPDRPGRGPMIDETMAEGEDIPADPSTLIRLGTITAVTLSPPRCVVRYGDPEADEDCETPPIRWLALRAGKTRHWSPPAWARKPCCCAPMARSAMAWPCSASTTTPRPRPATPWPN